MSRKEIKKHSGVLHAYKEHIKTRHKFLNLFNKQNSAKIISIYLNKTKAYKVKDTVRKVIEEEHKEETGVFGTKRGGTLEAILDPFGYNAPIDPIVDAKKENKRIKKALAEGKKIDASKVKTVNPAKDW